LTVYVFDVDIWCEIYQWIVAMFIWLGSWTDASTLLLLPYDPIPICSVLWHCWLDFRHVI